MSSRPYKFKDEDITKKDEDILTYNFSNLPQLNMKKYDNTFVDISGISFFTISIDNNVVVNYKDKNYLFKSLIISNNHDLVYLDNSANEDDYDTSLIIELIEQKNTNNKLYMVLPVNTSNIVLNQDINNSEYVQGMMQDIEAEKSEIIEDNNPSFIPTTGNNLNINNLFHHFSTFYKYSIDNAIFIVFPYDKSTLYSSETLSSDFFTEHVTPNENINVTIRKNIIGLKQKDSLETAYEDIYIDCAPVEDANTELIRKNKKSLFVLKPLLNTKLFKESNGLLIGVLTLIIAGLILFSLFKSIYTIFTTSSKKNQPNEEPMNMKQKMMKLLNNIFDPMLYLICGLAVLIGILLFSTDEVKELGPLNGLLEDAWYFIVLALSYGLFFGVIVWCIIPTNISPGNISKEVKKQLQINTLKTYGLLWLFVIVASLIIFIILHKCFSLIKVTNENLENAMEKYAKIIFILAVPVVYLFHNIFGIKKSGKNIGIQILSPNNPQDNNPQSNNS